MAAIDDLVVQIADEKLRARIQDELKKISSQKKFGLVFEEHLPECTPLYDVPIKRGSQVALKTGKIDEVYKVIDIVDGKALCISVAGKKATKEGTAGEATREAATGETLSFPLDDLVWVAEFGEPIYPYLKPIDTVCNAPDSSLWHTIIEAENYHALQLLEYLYAGKVDCIYIDPPYNTGARDWKYNNDYVDSSDAYRHSKWLSFMEKRLKLAKRLLNPKDSVLIITIDEKEYLHLGCLLEEMFPDARMQMVTSIVKPEGTQRVNEFSRTNEFIYFVFVGNAVVPAWKDMTSDEIYTNIKSDKLPYRNFRRTNSANVRNSRPNQFYPIFIDKDSKRIASIGEVMTPDVDKESIIPPLGTFAVFPLRDNGEEMIWYKTPSSLKTLVEQGFAYAQTKNGITTIQYLSSGPVRDIQSGKIVITEKTEEGELRGYYSSEKLTMPKTVWTLKTHIARDYGSVPLRVIFGEQKRFDFPKSLYAVHDCLNIATLLKPNALIVDFFAGSGTTLHAVNLLNAEDGGNRRCILVTNNEVSEAEAKSLSSQGFKPGDPEWERLGIAHYVTWPRTVCSIEGHDINGEPLKGNYLGSDMPMSDGFKANAAFFKLGFLDKTSVALGRQFKELLPLLWLKAGAIGECPSLDNDDIPEMLIFPENKFASLVEETAFQRFKATIDEADIDEADSIQTVFIITDYDGNYRAMANALHVKTTYQLYRDYLDNFRINHRRS